jgi:hypothetical protein
MADSDTEHLPRLVREQFGQILFTAVGFADRLLLSAILIRIWGTGNFEIWSAALAFAGFGSLFEFGFNLYYNNKITFQKERGLHADAERTLAEANFVIAVCALIGCAIMVGIATSARIVGTTDTHEGMIAAILLSVAATARLLIVGVSAQYRANREYSRFANISAVAELLRITGVATAVLAGADIVATALVACVIQLLIPVLFLFVDTRRRFQPHRIMFRIPRGAGLREALGMSGAYFGQLIPTILWMSVPVLYLQSLPLAAGAVAAFVLIRTLANLSRTPLQSLGVVVGLECGRRIALSDKAGALIALRGAARLFAVLSGLACGIVVGAGGAILFIWVGPSVAFDLNMAVAAMMPMLLGPAVVLAHNVLVASNSPYLAMTARWLQMVLTVIAYFMLPGLDAGLRVMVALAVGEILGYMPIAYYAVARLIPGSGFVFHLRFIAISLAAAASSGGIALWLFHASPAVGAWDAIAKLSAVLFFSAVFTLAFATDAGTRARLIDNFRSRVFGRVA